MQCPLVLLVEVGWREGKAFESEGKEMENGAWRKVGQGPTELDQIPEFKH
jgi:hypothetical protein